MSFWDEVNYISSEKQQQQYLHHAINNPYVTLDRNGP